MNIQPKEIHKFKQSLEIKITLNVSILFLTVQRQGNAGEFLMVQKNYLMKQYQAP